MAKTATTKKKEEKSAAETKRAAAHEKAVKRQGQNTYMANEATVDRKWFVVDADGIALGRLASQVAAVLRGKHKASFTPHVDTGDFVIVLNSDKVILTGKKLEQKYRRRHTLYMGGLKEIQFKKFMAEKSDQAVEESVKGMLPKNALGRKMFKKLRVYKGDTHEHKAQMPTVLEIERSKK